MYTQEIQFYNIKHRIEIQSSNVIDKPVEGDKNVEETPVSICKILIGFARSSDIMLIMITTLIFTGVGYTTDLMNAIVVLNMFKWETKFLNICTVFTSIGYTCYTLIFSKYVVSNKRIFIAAIIAIVFSFVNMSLVVVITSLRLTINWQILLIILKIITSIPIWQLDSVILTNMLGRMVKTNVQSFAESSRSILSLSSCIMVGIFIANENYLKYMLYSLVGLVAISLGIFIYKRERLINIKLVKL